MTQLDSQGDHLPPAREGVVDKTRLPTTNLLTLNRSYSKLGSNGTITAVPSVLHFGGFTVGNTHRLQLRLVNSSTSSTRLHIIHPTTPHFKVLCDRKGVLAPGMAEVLSVEFKPAELRYYYDCVRIHSQEGNMLIPVHAYPVMNEVAIPPSVDFGKCGIHVKKKRELVLRCSVPIEFEYEIRSSNEGADFEVEPAAGVIPANGEMRVAITFCPTRLHSQSTTLTLLLSQFNAAPQECVVAGVGFPAVELDKQLSEMAQQLQESQEAQQAAIQGERRGDAFSAWQARRRKAAASARGHNGQRLEPIRLAMPEIEPPPPDRKRDGIYLPADLDNAANMAYVLNQTPDKLRIRDIQAAVAEKKVALAERDAMLQRVMAADGPDADALDDPSVPAEVKALLFSQQLAGVVARQQAVASIRLGEPPPTAEMIAARQQKRRERMEEHQAQRERQDAGRWEPEVADTGALHLPLSPAAEAAPSSSSDGAAAAAPAVAGGYPGLQGFEPSFDEHSSSDWNRRITAWQRFVAAGRTVLYRLRAQRQLERLAIATGFRDPGTKPLASNADAVDGGAAAAALDDMTPQEALDRVFDPKLLRLDPLPVHELQRFQRREPVGSCSYADIDELSHIPLQVPMQYRVLGYEPEPFPGLTDYVPQLPDQPLMVGAEEEQFPHPVPAGVVPAGAAELTQLPPGCRQLPHARLPIGQRYATDNHVVARPVRGWGMDMEYRLQPQSRQHHNSARFEAPESRSLRAHRGELPFTSETWLARQQHWQVLPEAHLEPLSGPRPQDALDTKASDFTLKAEPLLCAPTAELVAQFLPWNLPDESLEEEAPPPAAKGGKGGGKGGSKDAKGAAGVAAETPPPPKQPTPEEAIQATGDVPEQLPRQVHLYRMEKQLLHRRREWERCWCQQVSQYNQLCSQPSLLALDNPLEAVLDAAEPAQEA